MMMPTHPALNSALNTMHDWGAPEQYPLKRMFCTRIGTLALAAIELLALGHSLGKLSYFTAHELTSLAKQSLAYAFPHHQRLAVWRQQPARAKCMAASAVDSAQLVAGLTSTLFIGAIFSPEINFRIHLQLGLASDTLAARQEKQREAMIRAEALAAALAEERKQRYDRFQTEQQAAAEAQRQVDTIDPALADLMRIKRYTTTS